MAPARYAYECPQCNSSIELSTTQAGQEIKCHSCSSKFEAPKLGVIKNLPAIEAEGSSANRQRSATAKTGSVLKSWLFAGGLLIAVLAGAGGYAAQVRADQFRVEIDIEDVIQSEYKAIDEAPVSDIYSILTDAEDESFTLEYSEAPYRTMNIKSGIVQQVAWACFGVAGAGLLMLLSSFFIRN